VGQHRLPVRFSIIPEITEKIQHDGRTNLLCRSEWQTTYTSQLLLELAGYSTLDRPVAGIMRPGGDLIDQKEPMRLWPGVRCYATILRPRQKKKLEAENTFKAYVFAQLTGQSFRLGSDGWLYRCWCDSDIQYVVHVAILDESIGCKFAVAPSRCH
jgi:hypothetical protein